MCNFGALNQDANDCPLHSPAPTPPATDPQGWVPLVEGCAMPELQGSVLVTVEIDADDEPWTYTTSGAYWHGDDSDYFITDRDEAFFGAEGFRIKRDRDEPAKRVTAWRHAPQPYSGGTR